MHWHVVGGWGGFSRPGVSISLLIGDGMIRLSGCFTGGRFGAVVDRWYWGTGGGTTAGESRAISHISTKLLT